MKKIILILVLGFSLFAGNSVFARNELNPGTYGSVVNNITGGGQNTSKVDSSAITTPEEAHDAAVASTTREFEAAAKEGNRVSTSSSTSGGNGIEVKVTEKIPGADCDGSDGDYTCTVKPGFGTVMELMGGIIKYFTFLASLGGVLFIVINGVMLSMGGMGGNKDEIKKRITMTIGGLILLLLSGLILHSIAPWIYQ